MFATRSLLIIGIFCLSSVIGEREVCDFEDSKCLTETANLTFREFIAGVPGVPSSDPLYHKYIEVNLDKFWYKFFEANLHGMKTCKVDLVKISAKDLKYEYYVGCRHLTLKAGYELNGDLGDLHLEGKGDECTVDFYEYQFQFHGDYTPKEGKDGESHIHLKTHVMKAVVGENGKVVYDFKNLFNGDKDKSDQAHTSVNKNWVNVHGSTYYQTMKAFTDHYIDNVNAYLDITSVQKLFSREK